MAAAFLVQILPTDMDRADTRLSQWLLGIASHWLNWYLDQLIMVKWHIYASKTMLVQIMACRLFETTPLSEPSFHNFKSDPFEQIQWS